MAYALYVLRKEAKLKHSMARVVSLIGFSNNLILDS